VSYRDLAGRIGTARPQEQVRQQDAKQNSYAYLT
jgi:hypothetical protein